MPAPASAAELVALMGQSGIVEPARLTSGLPSLPPDPREAARVLVREGWLTYFHAEQLLKGKWRGFSIGKYQILERLGAGGMGAVYLAEHMLMRRRVALKVLPLHLAKEAWFLDRFYREAEAVAAVDHPNIVHAHDVDRDGEFHFLVMEYVDGSSLQQIVHDHGPLSFLRSAHYIRQAALGLEHARLANIVHRDIKPGNLLLDRQGVVKILDMGLACFQEGPGKNQVKPSERVMVGTDDYLAPEQIVDSDSVDIRADIYGLGATLYYLLTGKPPFPEAPSPSLKLIWHLTRTPAPVTELRPDTPAALDNLLRKMLAKNPWERPQTPADVARALEPLTQKPIEPPPIKEMPQLSPALRSGRGPGIPQGGASSRKSWVFGSRVASNALQDTPPPSQAPTNAARRPGSGNSNSTGDSTPPRF